MSKPNLPFIFEKARLSRPATPCQVLPNVGILVNDLKATLGASSANSLVTPADIIRERPFPGPNIVAATKAISRPNIFPHLAAEGYPEACRCLSSIP